MDGRLMLEVSVEQVAQAVHSMDATARQNLLALTPELFESPGLVSTITYHPEEKGYLARCVSIDAIAWGQTLAEAGDALIDAVIETAETLVEDCPNPSKELRKRLSYAQAVYWRRESRNDVKRLLGLTDNVLHLS
ncbi:MAG: hypothetical protein NT169_00550 [Chloroflexi bacterium]|nr:hypothetical protein [Chloroflexota bacterium]